MSTMASEPLNTIVADWQTLELLPVDEELEAKMGWLGSLDSHDKSCARRSGEARVESGGACILARPSSRSAEALNEGCSSEGSNAKLLVVV